MKYKQIYDERDKHIELKTISEMGAQLDEINEQIRLLENVKPLDASVSVSELEENFLNDLDWQDLRDTIECVRPTLW